MSGGISTQSVCPTSNLVATASMRHHETKSDIGVSQNQVIPFVRQRDQAEIQKLTPRPKVHGSASQWWIAVSLQVHRERAEIWVKPEARTSGTPSWCIYHRITLTTQCSLTSSRRADLQTYPSKSYCRGQKARIGRSLPAWTLSSTKQKPDSAAILRREQKKLKIKGKEMAPNPNPKPPRTAVLRVFFLLSR